MAGAEEVVDIPECLFGQKTHALCLNRQDFLPIQLGRPNEIAAQLAVLGGVRA